MSLPSAYQEVEYIQSSGTQYINTWFSPSNKTKVVCKLSSDWIMYWCWVNWQYQALSLMNYNQYYTGRFKTTSSSNQTIQSTVPVWWVHTFENSQVNWFYIDWTLIWTYTQYTFTESRPMYLFAWNGTWGTPPAYWSGSIYYLKIYENWTLIRDFVPCYRKSDNEIWLYDLVNDTFYTNSWTGTFTKWPNVEPPVPTYKLHWAIQTFHHKWYNWRDDYQEVKFIQSSGTQYIDTWYKWNQDTAFEVKVCMTWTNTQNQQRPWGDATTNTSNAISIVFATWSNSVNNRFWWTVVELPASDTSVWTDYVVHNDKNAYTLNWITKTRTWTVGTFVTDNNMWLFQIKNKNWQEWFIGRMYYAKLRESWTLVRDFIPCYKRSNWEIGLYDLVEWKFYANAWTGTFTKGPDTYEGEIAPTENTLFLLRNNWEIADHSDYNHTMNWYGTESYDLLNNGRKVINFDWSNISYSDVFNESINKTTFTLHCRAKMKSWTTEDNIVGWCGRAKNDSSSSDRRWARFQRDSWLSNYYILAWPNSTSRVTTWNTWWITPSTSEFVLMTATVDWWTYKIYKNWSLVQTYSGATIRWWSSTWTRFYIWWAIYSDWTKRSNTLSYSYIWETILEDRVRTATEIADYYNAFKSDYVELTLKTPSEIAALITTGDFWQTDFSAALAELNAHPKNYYRQFLSDNNLYTSYGKSNVMWNWNWSAYTKSAQIKTATYAVVLRYNESTELWETYRYGGWNPSFDV